MSATTVPRRSTPTTTGRFVNSKIAALPQKREIDMRNLDELRDALNGAPRAHAEGVTTRDILAYAEAHGLPVHGGNIDYPGLPNFGGDEPRDTEAIWSWDEENLLVTGDDITPFVICPRSEWCNR